jgi:WD40 repeat protein
VLRQKPRNGTVAAQVFSNLIKQVLIVPLAEPLTHINAVYSARFSPDARRVVTASADGTAQLWNVNTGGPLTAPLRHSAAVWSAQFSPDGLRVATASEDKTARVWDASTGQPLIPPLEHSGSVGFVHFSPGGELLVTGTWEPDWKMRIWDAKSGRPLIEPIAEVHRLRCSPFSLDGGKLVTSWKTNSVMVWDPRTGAQLVRPLEHDQFVWTAEFSPDGRRILTAAHDGMARIWDAATGRLLVQPLNNGGPLWLARFSPDGQRVLTVCNDLTVQFWDASTGRALTGPVTYGQTTEYQIYYARFGEHAAYRSDRAAQFSADGQMVVVAFGGKPLVLDANTGRPLTEPLRHNLVRYAEFSRDSRMIVTGSIDGTARIWGIRNGASQQWMASARDQGKNTPSVFVPVPEWVPRLLETIAEERLNEEGAPEPAPSAQLRTLRRQLSENSGSDIWTRWGKWLTADTSAETNAFR